MSRKIAVRMDDITPDMNWDNFIFFQRLFEEAGITPLLGIVPENQDPKLCCGAAREDFYDVIGSLEEKGYSLAMHGFHHVYVSKSGGIFPLNNYSEFAGISFDKQKEMLMLGKNQLKEHGIETDIFMAPAHSYDYNTLRALKETGFSKITDGFGKNPYIYKGITFYPISFRLSSSLRQNEGVTTMVVHANTVTEAEKERYARIFMKYGQNMISYSEYLAMKPVKRNIFGRVGEYLLAKCKFILVRVRRH